jgi:tetratricopeptide (TPR) repeat protein
MMCKSSIGIRVALLGALVGCGGGQAKPKEAAPAASTPVALAPADASPKAGADVERAVAAIKMNDFASAKAALDKALQSNPTNGTALYYMGVCLENTGDKKGAEARYKAAVEIAPEIAEAAVNLGALYLDANRYDDAIAVSEKALAKRTEDPDLHANIAVALRGKGDKQGAALHYDRAIRIVGDNANLRFGFGSLLLEMGDKDKAAVQLKAALAHAGTDRALCASIGRALGAAGAFADCIAAFDHAIQQGDDAELRVQRGLCRHGLKDEAGAKADFESAAKQNPKFPQAHYYLGEALLALGDAAQAAKEFDAAVAAAPDGKLAKRAREQAEAARKKKSGKK